MTINKQALREIAAAAVGAHERLSVMPPDDIFDISLAEGTQLDADITALNALNSAANPTTVLALLDELEAKDKRIAELEAREINLPPYSFFDFKQGSPFKSGAYCHIDSVNQELSKHGIKMTAAAGKGE
ncbi:ead/Ea22-like family protein [Enterobacter hormaechei]